MDRDKYRGIPTSPTAYGTDFVHGDKFESACGKVFIIPTGHRVTQDHDTEDMFWQVNYIIEVHPDTVGQYTGKKDEALEKTDIYAGSRITVTATRSRAWDDFEELEQPFEASVFWEESTLCWFYEEKENGEGGHPLVNCKCVVIGTIHDAEEVKVRVCRECGCKDDDCSQCIEATGHPCHWVEPDLCSRCFDKMQNAGQPSNE